MSITVQTVHGILNDMKITIDNMKASPQQKITPNKESSSSKRQRVEEETLVEKDSGNIEIPPIEFVMQSSPRRSFVEHFRRTTDGYCSMNLSAKSAEEFIYDWYAKNLGTVKGNIVTLTVGRWQSTVGHKLSTDNQGDGKNLIRLAEKVSSEVQLSKLKTLQPDAAKDTSHTAWEIDMKATAKTLTKLLGDFLTMKEGKVGNAKAYTVGAMARRWKQLKYPDPTTEELLYLQESGNNKTSGSNAKVSRSK